MDGLSDNIPSSSLRGSHTGTPSRFLSDDSELSDLLSKDLSDIKDALPRDWDDVKNMDPVAVILLLLILWVLLCILVNILRCLFYYLFCRCCNDPRRRGYTVVKDEAVCCNSQNLPPPFNPEYQINPRRYSPSRAKCSYAGRNLLWAACCFECCCRDDRDLNVAGYDCCDVGCGLCLFEVCCPRRREQQVMYL
ncbi:expressed unknown protein [Seminavis robusta]|uniref:Uncharacterized protein n=1 Tax=Seminavis robusta TaxID=568900 RepID=A0A9N8DGL3_9STRA|nr:expressed unknown protein [Seminavis robusta]|eukprot:Sro80_g043241.1  (193) ;mRNA; r:97764-98342